MMRMIQKLIAPVLVASLGVAAAIPAQATEMKPAKTASHSDKKAAHKVAKHESTSKKTSSKSG